MWFHQFSEQICKDNGLLNGANEVKGEFNPCVVTHAVMKKFAINFIITIGIFEDRFIGTHFQVIIGLSDVQFENGTTLLAIKQLCIHVFPQLDAVGSCSITLRDELLGKC